MTGCAHCNRKFKSKQAWAAHLDTCKGWLKAAGIRAAKPIHLIYIDNFPTYKTWCGKTLSYKNSQLTSILQVMSCRSCLKAYLGQHPFKRRVRP